MWLRDLLKPDPPWSTTRSRFSAEPRRPITQNPSNPWLAKPERRPCSPCAFFDCYWCNFWRLPVTFFGGFVENTFRVISYNLWWFILRNDLWFDIFRGSLLLADLGKLLWLLISMFCVLDRPCVMLVFSGFGFMIWPNGLGVLVLFGLW
jgi:hypothetical protein